MGGGGGGKKGGGKQRVTDYYASLHYGFCLGPVDAVTQVKVSEKTIDLPIQSNKSGLDYTQYEATNKKEMFGGPKEGGGINGRIFFMFGNGDQRSPAQLARRLLGALATNKEDSTVRDMVPGYRGLASIFFSGRDGEHKWSRNSKAGFIWGSNYPSLPSVWATLRRAPKGLSGSATIENKQTYEEETGERDKETDEAKTRTVNRTFLDANPAHIIYECMTAPWGLAHPTALIDTASFLAAATTLRNEEFGLSFFWDRQSTIEDFVTEVLDHISGVLAVDPNTGKFYLKLLRGDYDVAKLIELNPGNSILTEFTRTSWGEIVNTVNVSWTNPINEQTETVTAHDDAALAIQQSEVLSSRNFYGIRNAALAGRVALREVRMASRSLVSCMAEVDRTAWKLKPGDTLVIDWPEEGIERMVMRVGPIDYGKAGSPSIRISLLEDIFGTQFTVYGDQATKYIAPGSDPAPLDHLFAGGGPYYIVANAFNDQIASEIEYPETYTLLLCAQDRRDVRVTDYVSQRPDITGVLKYFPDGSINNQSRGLLSNALILETKTDIFPVQELLGNPPDGGMIGMIVDDIRAPTIFEMVAVESTTASSIVVRRGVLDTVPRVWPTGTPIWFIDPETRIFDSKPRSVGEIAKYRFLPKTSRGQLRAEDAPEVSVLLDARQHRPYRPANVRVNGKRWGPLSVAYDTVLAVTWSRRNRLTETSLALTWDQGDVTPEAGQTTTVKLMKRNVLIQQWTGLTGTSLNINLAPLYSTIRQNETEPSTPLTLVVSSVRDGLDSLQAVEYQLRLFALANGWNRGWGFNWNN